MFYVGAMSSFKGKPQAGEAIVSVLEKLGYSQGRALRFLNEHKPREINGERHRAIVFVLHDGFILRNDLIQLSVRQYKCDWQTAKFHIYREAAVDVKGNVVDWPELAKPTKEEPKAEPVVPQDVVLRADGGVGHERIQVLPIS